VAGKSTSERTSSTRCLTLCALLIVLLWRFRASFSCVPMWRLGLSADADPAGRRLRAFPSDLATPKVRV